MSVQDLIVPGRRVWHRHVELVAVTHDIVGKYVFIRLGMAGNLWHLAADLHPILSATEVRGLPVGAVLVDTLTGEDCAVDWEGTPDHKVAHTEDGEYAMSSAWPDRDLSNRFALKSYGEADDPRSSEETLPTEEA